MTAAESASSPASPRAVLRHPSFLRFWSARLLASLAVQMQAVAVGWQVYDMTSRALDLGLVGLAQFLPQLLFALVAGHVADRFDRRRILGVCMLAEAACAAMLLALALSGNGSRWSIFAVLTVFGTARAFESPANASLLPNLVPAAHLKSAIAWGSSAQQTAVIAGPALGGLLYALGPVTVFAVAAGAILAAAALVSTVRLSVAATARPPGREPLSWATLLAGLAFIRSRPAILGAISLDLFAVLLGGATALLPIYARDILFVGPWGLGLLRSAPALGALAMAVALASRPLRRRAGPLMFGAVAVFGVATVVFGLSTSFPVSFAALAMLGASDMVSVVVRSTLIQLSTPDAMRGRVSAVNFLFIGCSNQLGEFESGVTAAWLGAVPAVLIGGIGTLLVVVLWAWRFPSLRRVDDIAVPAQ